MEKEDKHALMTHRVCSGGTKWDRSIKIQVALAANLTLRGFLLRIVT